MLTLCWALLYEFAHSHTLRLNEGHFGFVPRQLSPLWVADTRAVKRLGRVYGSSVVWS